MLVTTRAFSSLAILLALAGPVQAHSFAGAGLVDGFAHPFAGIDHVLAMIAVGLWAAQQGGRTVWLIPASFVTAMVAGGWLGMSDFPLLAVEPAIALSVLLLGLAVAASVRAPLPVGMALAGAFALFHGHAHGAELPVAAEPAMYAIGFLAATASLHGVGIAVGRVLTFPGGRTLVRLCGGGTALAGLALLVA